MQKKRPHFFLPSNKYDNVPTGSFQYVNSLHNINLYESYLDGWTSVMVMYHGYK